MAGVGELVVVGSWVMWVMVMESPGRKVVLPISKGMDLACAAAGAWACGGWFAAAARVALDRAMSWRAVSSGKASEWPLTKAQTITGPCLGCWWGWARLSWRRTVSLD